MTRPFAPYVEALLAIAALVWVTSALLPVLGLASAALLFLLPVLLAAMRGGVGPGLFAALAGSAAYNYFLLEPRHTFRVHQLENLVSVFVLGAVAIVTSRLATRLMAREAEANERADASAQAAALSALLASGAPDAALDEGVAFLAERYGPLRLVGEGALEADAAAFSSLDRAAAAWALHNGDITGHGTETMPAADWTFVPLVPRTRSDTMVAALARPADGRTRSAAELEQVRQMVLLLGQCRDRASLETERRERERVEAADALRRTFLASLAHDFRTPLTVIAGRLELLARESPDAQDALVAARRLDRMMGDLLGAARIEAGTLAVKRESLDLVDVASAACEGVVLPRGIVLRRAIAADLPFVSADPLLLHHILTNLVDNAARHARSEVTLSARVEHGAVALMVDDDGAGVPEAERARIFERFARIEGDDRSQGSGLGLAIVKGFADAMAVPVRVAERPGGGARFVLVLPMVYGEAA